ncbi:MAG: ShlB/FhaC/HecB family hemolysin secretion/activation protein [Pseudomonadota bacterium]|nr:ShlB/FhaC/HecB family hemolysin secretion/activation protein [Pseudomonadota bacterium]
MQQAGQRRAWAAACGVLFALAAASGFAAAPAPATPTVVPTPSQLSPDNRPDTPPEALPAQPAAPVPRELGKPSDELAIDVSSFSVADDAPAELKAALPALTAPFVGKGKNYEDLVNAASAVTRFLQRDLGYYLGYAYIPEQAPQDGQIRIGVLEGRLDHVELVWSEGLPVRQEVVQAYLDHLRPGSILTVRDVERTVFLVNDLRGITVRAEVKAGSAPGTAILVFTPVADARLSGKVDVDNEGSRFIGETRVGVTGNWNSPLGRGDGLALSALTSTTGGLNFGLFGYTTPLGSDGWRAGASVSALHYSLDRHDFPLGLSGNGITANAFALYPWVRSRNLNLFVLGAADRKNYSDSASVITTKRHVDDLVASLTGDFRDTLLSGAVNTFELTGSSGHLHYDGGFPSGLDDAQSYRKVDYSFSRLQNLLTNRVLLYVALRGQYALDNLDTTEQFRAGGPDGVRAFASGEGTGDSGQLLTTELRWLPPEWLLGRWSHEIFVAAFVDAARVEFRHDPGLITRPPGYVNTASFGGAGVSLVWARPNAYALRLSVAKATHGVAVSDTATRDPRAYFQGTWFY